MAVLGMTMDGQRAAGMINNRVFEALACGREGGSRFLTEHFPELEEMFGQHIRLVVVGVGVGVVGVVMLIPRYPFFLMLTWSLLCPSQLYP